MNSSAFINIGLYFLCLLCFALVSLSFSGRIFQELRRQKTSHRICLCILGSAISAFSIFYFGMLPSYLVICLTIFGAHFLLLRKEWRGELYLTNAYMLNIMTFHTLITALAGMLHRESTAPMGAITQAEPPIFIFITCLLLVLAMLLGMKVLDFDRINHIVRHNHLRRGMIIFMGCSNIYLLLQLFATRETVLSTVQLLILVIMAALLLLVANWSFLFFNMVILRLLNIEERNVILTRQAQTDCMTGLLNKVTAINKINETMPQGGTLFVIDVDNFKQVNDTHGHACGDDVLMHIAATMQHLFRAEDVLGRFGGDEYLAFISPALSDQQAERRCRELCLSCRNSIPVSNSSAKITLSIGALQIPQGKCPCFEAAFPQADYLLYQSKQKGKDSYTMGSFSGCATSRQRHR